MGSGGSSNSAIPKTRKKTHSVALCPKSLKISSGGGVFAAEVYFGTIFLIYLRPKRICSI